MNCVQEFQTLSNPLNLKNRESAGLQEIQLAFFLTIVREKKIERNNARER